MNDKPLRPLKIRVLFLIRKIIKKGRGRFLRLKNGTLDHAYIEWTETILLYKNTCQMPLDEKLNIWK